MDDEKKIHIVTESGFEWDFDEDVGDDQELLDALVEVDKNPGGYTKAIKMMMGEDGKAALYEHLRNEKGRVPATKVAQAIGEIMKLLGEASKSAKN